MLPKQNKNQKFIAHSSGGWQARSRCWQVQCLSEVCSSETVLSRCPHMTERTKGSKGWILHPHMVEEQKSKIGLGWVPLVLHQSICEELVAYDFPMFSPKDLSFMTPQGTMFHPCFIRICALFFLWLNNIPLCGCTAADGCLGCFHSDLWACFQSQDCTYRGWRHGSSGRAQPSKDEASSSNPSAAKKPGGMHTCRSRTVESLSPMVILSNLGSCLFCFVLRQGLTI
jgi:hypothetical protein